jgi:hypothetical protein
MPTASLRDFCEALSIMTDNNVPQRDPTLLTTPQLTREISNARELIECKVSGAVVIRRALRRFKGPANSRWCRVCSLKLILQIF